MGRRNRKKLPEGLFPAEIDSLSHDGRGIARIEGKTTFIDNALPGEAVSFKYTYRRSKFDEGRAEEIHQASADRVTPPCAHASICGGCSLQHLDGDIQITRKQATLAEQLDHFGGLQPETWLPPLRGAQTGYRSKARLGVKYVRVKDEVLVGFREKRSGFLARLNACEVLLPEVGQQLTALADMIYGLEMRERIPQIELAAGDSDIALVFRHLEDLPPADIEAIEAFCQERGWHCYLQPGNESTVHRIWPEVGDQPPRLHYEHPEAGVELAFHPMDFTQVNQSINRDMVPLALDLLDLSANHRVLDLFCGLGNFTIPAAKRAAEVIGVEGSMEMVHRGTENAQRNGLDNVSFYAWNLTEEVAGQPWAKEQFDRILIDPPRTGALEVMPLVIKMNPQKVVYVSCNPATLARDAKELINAGYRLSKAGVMDMFPQTTHVESIALFERS